MNRFPVRIYAADVNPLRDEALFSAAYEKVTEERRKKTDRIHAEGGKRLSLGVELLLLHGLSELGAGDVRFRYGENGKPYLDGAEELYFNLSHSGETAVCAIAPCEVGCDVERIRTRELAVARRFFTPEEYEAVVSAGDDEARRKMFCRFWTLKESFLKVTGRGLQLGLDSFRIIPEKGKISVIQSVDQRTYYFREYETAEGYCCAVCAVQDDFEPQVRRTDLRGILGSEL